MAKSDKIVYVCQECGKESSKWLGRCPDCGQWNTMVEIRASTFAAPAHPVMPVAPPQELSEVSLETADRFPLAIGEFDRVLGGGLVAGSLVLISRDPRIGQSTLLLPASAPPPPPSSATPPFGRGPLPASLRDPPPPHVAMRFLRECFGQAIGEGFGHDRVVVVVTGLEEIGARDSAAAGYTGSQVSTCDRLMPIAHSAREQT